MKQKFKSMSGITLIEMLIAVVISSVMMAALFTSYNVVNNSYSQVSDRATISRTGRDVVGMLLRDVRMAGYFDIKSIQYANDEMYPIVISKSKNFKGSSRKCDKIDIVYGDVVFEKNRKNKKGVLEEVYYPVYKITYKCVASRIPDRKKAQQASGKFPVKDIFAITKSKVVWDESANTWKNPTGSDKKTYKDELILDHVEDLIFNPIDDKGLIIDPVPTPSQNKSGLYKIRAVDISIILRSPDSFYKSERKRTLHALANNLRNKVTTDRYLRESIVVTAHNRNIGMIK